MNFLGILLVLGVSAIRVFFGFLAVVEGAEDHPDNGKDSVGGNDAPDAFDSPSRGTASGFPSASRRATLVKVRYQQLVPQGRRTLLT